MTRDEKEQQIAAPDGKIFEVNNIQIQQVFLSPNYTCSHAGAVVMTSTGHLKVFELLPKSEGRRSFSGRWDKGKEALDIDIDQEASPEEKWWFTHRKHGYIGHWSKKALNNTTSTYTYNVILHTPQEKIFEGIVSFSAIRRVSISGMASITKATSDQKISDQEAPGQYHPWAFGEKQLFCAACQTVTTQIFTVDPNKEIVATCHCDRFVKFHPKSRRA